MIFYFFARMKLFIPSNKKYSPGESSLLSANWALLHFNLVEARLANYSMATVEDPAYQIRITSFAQH
jgi:hypothetical protein